MKKFSIKRSAREIAGGLSLFLEEHNPAQIDNVATLDEANGNSLCFYQQEEYKEDLLKTEAGLVLVPQDFDLDVNLNIIKVENPYFSFLQVIKVAFAQEKGKKISKKANINKTAKIGKGAAIGDFVSIGAHGRIGENVLIYPNVTIYDDTEIGDNVIIHSGVVLGSDGFGFLYKDGVQHKIPQLGKVVIGNDVEIGAGSTIDRGTLGATSIGDGTKLDNLVQIGHNCTVGKNCCLCAQVGLAGNTKVGDLVYLAGQVGVAGHLSIGSYTKVGAKSGIMKDVPEGAEIWGTPAVSARDQKRIIVAQRQLPKVLPQLKKLLKK